MKLPTKKYRKLEIPENKRVLVVSDIHGQDTLFGELLGKASYTPDDVLIILGDIIEKGKESLKTLRRIMELYKNGNVLPLIGMDRQ
jgi:protein phosphatase